MPICQECLQCFECKAIKCIVNKNHGKCICFQCLIKKFNNFNIRWFKTVARSCKFIPYHTMSDEELEQFIIVTVL